MNLSELPDDAITCILRLLDMRSLSRFSRVSKQFSALANEDDIWYGLVTRTIGTQLPSLPEDVLTWKQYYAEYIFGFCFDPNKVYETHKLHHPRKLERLDHRSFQGALCKSAIPLHGTYEYSMTCTATVPDGNAQWCGFGVADQRWSPRNCGWWEKNGGIGLYSMGSMYVRGTAVSTGLAMKRAEPNLCSIRVNRAEGKIVFSVNGREFEYVTAALSEPTELYPAFILLDECTIELHSSHTASDGEKVDAKVDAKPQAAGKSCSAM
eukprot:TRINITY_DN10131_c0_g1_i1.p1 TRINITY_DN10131_c0_g1~~TRINITY_DN10131_c0_g1_i1.p1  ORF type:complete len:266 (+),score=37.06 TRINITY_DN10131_c0_g1_i1:38-835(+)